MKYRLIRHLTDRDAYFEIEQMYHRGFVDTLHAALTYPAVKETDFHFTYQYTCEVKLCEYRLCYVADGADYVLDIYIEEHR